MQPSREENAPIKEKINRPTEFKWCTRCDRVIPVFNISERESKYCPLCGSTLVLIGEGTRREWFGK